MITTAKEFFEEWEKQWILLQKQNTHIREGQGFMNFLYEYWPDKYHEILNTEYDCFYLDFLLPKTKQYIEETWKSFFEFFENTINIVKLQFLFFTQFLDEEISISLILAPYSFVIVRKISLPPPQKSIEEVCRVSLAKDTTLYYGNYGNIKKYEQDFIHWVKRNLNEIDTQDKFVSIKKGV